MTASAAAPPTAPPIIMPVGGLELLLVSVCSSGSPLPPGVPRDGPVGADTAGSSSVSVELAGSDSVRVKLMDVAMERAEEVVESVMMLLSAEERESEPVAPGLRISESMLELGAGAAASAGEDSTTDGLGFSSRSAVAVGAGAASSEALGALGAPASADAVDGAASTSMVSDALEGDIAATAPGT